MSVSFLVNAEETRQRLYDHPDLALLSSNKHTRTMRRGHGVFVWHSGNKQRLVDFICEERQVQFKHGPFQHHLWSTVLLPQNDLAVEQNDLAVEQNTGNITYAASLH